MSTCKHMQVHVDEDGLPRPPTMSAWRGQLRQREEEENELRARRRGLLRDSVAHVEHGRARRANISRLHVNRTQLEKELAQREGEHEALHGAGAGAARQRAERQQRLQQRRQLQQQQREFQEDAAADKDEPMDELDAAADTDTFSDAAIPATTAVSEARGGVVRARKAHHPALVGFAKLPCAVPGAARAIRGTTVKQQPSLAQQRSPSRGGSPCSAGQRPQSARKQAW